MNIEQDSVVNNDGVANHCKICGGKETIQIFRNDLEEYEEIKCGCCK